MTAATDVRRGIRLTVYGIVQGVGFRPYVYRLAGELGLAGDVRNAGGHVVINATGPVAAIEAFVALLPQRLPAHARLDRVDLAEMSPMPYTGFQVLRSDGDTAGGVGIPPDLATCSACVRELFDPADRRFRYPFITCTACGPRATIVEALPYDRERTTMRAFPLCPACAAEYRDPGSRRFHAEPIACANCGPRLCWYPGEARHVVATGEDALGAAIRSIAAGGIVAVKGVGGYQLVCDAGAEPAVARLRAGKHRPTKPFAVMAPNRDVLTDLCVVDDPAVARLRSAAAPIVLLPRRATAPLAESVAPGLPEVGVFLPYSPVHHLLLAELARPLVVTSGNRAGEPIATTDDVARATLGAMTDGILGHDRAIHARHDDSVLRVATGRTRMVRRARGYAPGPLPLPATAPRPVLGLGAQLKHTIALALGAQAVVGPHTGDLSDAATYTAFTDGVARLCRLHEITPALYAHDLHPGYLSTQYARQWPAHARMPIQHHHAHVVATAAEHGVTGPFLGIAYDGLGYGDDGTLWGGEFLLADYRSYRRVGRIATVPLADGEVAVRRPARTALGYLFGAERLGFDAIAPQLAGGLLDRLDPREVTTVRAMIDKQVRCPRASSVGRLFDAAAALLGLCDDNSYEGEAAVRLEAAAAGVADGQPLAWRLCRQGDLWVFDPVPTLTDLLIASVDDPVGVVAARFHSTLAEVTLAMADRIAQATGVRTVCLGGGVYQNDRLTTGVLRRLTAAGFDVFVGERIPVNDGGISYGQVAIAAARLAEG